MISLRNGSDLFGRKLPLLPPHLLGVAKDNWPAKSDEALKAAMAEHYPGDRYRDVTPAEAERVISQGRRPCR